MATTIGIILFEGFTLLDAAGPYDIFSRIPDIRIATVSSRTGKFRSESGPSLDAEYIFADTPKPDILFVPGGKGVTSLLEDEAFVAGIRNLGLTSGYVTAVCTGSLLLAAAGLLDGYAATTHWLSLDLLALFPVRVSQERVVVDGTRITGGGVTAGIDFGLTLVARIFGEPLAKEIQLAMEYDPRPPFDCGNFRTAPAETVNAVRQGRVASQQKRREAILRVLARDRK